MRKSPFPNIQHFMNAALVEAKKASLKGEVPVGAVIVFEEKIITVSHNDVYGPLNPAGHAEILAIQKAASILKTTFLSECDLYVTLEPCAMCAQAISLSRIRRLYYGAYDVKGGGVDHGVKLYEQKSTFHKPEVYSGFLEEECKLFLQNFFKEKREK